MTPRALIAPARLAGATLMRTQSDERLVDLVRAGNDGAFEAIVSRYSAPLLRYCKGFLPEARAEDTVQQTFVRALAALRESEAEMRLRPWLYRIAPQHGPQRPARSLGSSTPRWTSTSTGSSARIRRSSARSAWARCWPRSRACPRASVTRWYSASSRDELHADRLRAGGQ